MAKLRVLLTGSGGREHALALALRRSDKLGELYVAPGSDAMADCARCVGKLSSEHLVDFALQHELDLVIFGPEAELVEGYADRLRAAGVLAFGPSRAAARLEGSKDFLKSMLFAAGVPCAASQSFTDLDAARAYLATRALPIVLKTDGLAGGKGVVICEQRAEASAWLERYLSGEAFGAAGQRVVVEDYLAGDEISFFCLVDAAGEAYPLAAARDYKRIFDGDQGPNTGGMGAFTPVPEMSLGLQREVMRDIVRPSLRQLAAMGAPYSGFLFAGLMLTDDGPKLLEYNIRLGDPETQVILSGLSVDLLELCYQAARGRVAEELAAGLGCQRAEACVNVVLAAAGYPQAPEAGAAIAGLDGLGVGTDVYHAGTYKDGETWRVGGGRVLNVIGRGADLQQARARAYGKVNQIDFAGMQLRRDIGD